MYSTIKTVLKLNYAVSKQWVPKPIAAAACPPPPPKKDTSAYVIEKRGIHRTSELR
jgi:hypothetical protein